LGLPRGFEKNGCVPDFPLISLIFLPNFLNKSFERNPLHCGAAA